MTTRIPGGQARGPVRDSEYHRPRSLSGLDPALRCLAGRRHLLDEGVTYEETVNGARVWVARLVCVRCGSVRVTTYEPHAHWVPLGPHRYFTPAAYRALKESTSADDARRAMLNALWKRS